MSYNNMDTFGEMILDMVKERDTLDNEKIKIIDLVKDQNPEGTPHVSCLEAQIMGIDIAMRIVIRTFRDMFDGESWESWRNLYQSRMEWRNQNPS